MTGQKIVSANPKLGRDYTIGTLIRGLELLEVLARHGPELTAKQISDLTGIGLSTTFRFLQTLLKADYIRFNDQNRAYSLGLRPFELGMAVLRQLDVRKAALPLLQELNQITGKTIALCVLDVDAAIYVEVLPSTTPIQIYSRVGRRVDLHCTGVGKILLSGLGDEQLEEFLRNPLPAYNERTLADPAMLRQEIQRIRREGVAFDDGEKISGIRCVAGPIHNHWNEIVASFSVAGTSHQMTPQAVLEVARLVKTYAGRISAELGCPIRLDEEEAAVGPRLA